MSPSDSSGSISDISEFAAWEALHPSQPLGESEREDMERPERRRIWGDRDSSNDARSSDEEAQERGMGHPLSFGTRTLAGGAMRGGKATGPPIPSSDAESEEVSVLLITGREDGEGGV
jgi:hypothetical protein